MKPRIPDPKARTGGQRDGSAKNTLADGRHLAPDIVRAGLLQSLDTLAAIVRRNHRMAIDADNDSTPGHAQRGIQSRRDDPSRVINQAEVWMLLCQGFNDLSG